MMDLLHIHALRPGADPNHPGVPNAVNYDEAKANPYPKLPDPLVMNDGRRVTTAAQWWSERRPEMVEMFDREVYGRLPEPTPKVTWEQTAVTEETVSGVAALTRNFVGHVDNHIDPAIHVDIEMTLTTPAHAPAPAPVILEYGFRFPPGFKFKLPPPKGPTAKEQVLARGWGYAEVFPTTIQADNGAGLTSGIIGLMNRGQPRKPDDWGALRAWAWGASQVLDYFETDPSVNARHVAIGGLSRYGKAALVAMAYDARFAIALVASSGEGGARLHRRNYGELVENLAGAGEYHWMAGNFMKYASTLTPADLPVDSHELIAMCAPRPIFISCGSPAAGDAWVDARGMFLAEAAAGPVYRLLGVKDLGTTEMPPIGAALVTGELGWRQHSAGHTVGDNWPVFLDYASRFFGASGSSASASLR